MLSYLKRNISVQSKDKLALLLDSQFWSRDEIMKYQLDKVTLILNHAAKYVPYYRKLFRDKKINIDGIKSLDDLACIPVLSKRDIQQNLNSMVAESVDIRALFSNSTGGSTGVPLNFYQDASYIAWADAARLRAWRYMVGATEKDLEAVLWGAERDIGKGVSIRKALYHVLREGCLPLNSFDMKPSEIKKFCRLYNVLKPKTLRGYASSLHVFADFVSTENIRIVPPSAIISSAETLLPQARRKIETVLGAPVYDSYGCREVSQIATECTAHDGLHVVWENQYVELVNGSVVVTNLHNYAMPFIRYEIGDLADSLSFSECACGRNGQKIKNIKGRIADNIVLENGRIVHGEYFTHLFYAHQNISRIQVVYHKKSGRLTIRVSSPVDCNGLADEVKRRIREDFGIVNIDFIQTDKFEKTETGKYKFVYMAE